MMLPLARLLVAFSMLLAGTTSCSKLPGSGAVATDAGAGNPTGPACSFQGSVSTSVRLLAPPESSDAGTRLRIGWDAAAPAGGSWVPPTRVKSVHLPYGVECLEKFDVLLADGVVVTPTAGREIDVLLPAAWVRAVSAKCESRRLRLPLVLYADGYAAPCRGHQGVSLLNDVLDVDLTIDAAGHLSVTGFEGRSVNSGL